MKKPQLVLVGNGMAGVRTLEELLRIAPDRYDITVFGAEPHPNYNRILLSPVWGGERSMDQIILNDWWWYAEHHITLHSGCTVTDADRARRVVSASDAAGKVISAQYDRLIIATGSTPFMLPIPGTDLQGVLTYPHIAHTPPMITTAPSYRHAVVIGGGLLGLEAANGLMKRGMQVTVVHVADWLMERQLDAVAGKMLQQSLQERGMQFLLGAQTQALLGHADGHPHRYRQRQGAPPRVRAPPVQHRNETSNTLKTTTDARFYAVGECAAHRGIAYGLVAPLFEQGKVLANHLAEFGIGRYQGSQTSTKLKVTGIDLFSAGNFHGGGHSEEIVLSDPGAGVYKKLVIQDDKLVGACLYGDTVDGNWYFKLLRDGRSVDDIRDKLMFGESQLGDTGHEGQHKAAALQDSDEVCGCNGVTKGRICKAIREQGLFTLEEVRKHTKASASCGSCTRLGEQILMFAPRGGYSATPKTRALCGCTGHGHQAVRDAIRTLKLLSIQAVFEHLQWRTPNGCASCRPAVNYYLVSTWPKDARDDPQSRAINERSHANIQKDGSYSVIPRIWGGETTADELRRIADVADKYRIPTIKLTGGQRIDLLGVKKEDLVGVWKDLAMPSGHAYAKALRTVKTCVGSEWCRMGVQDSTRLGKELERAMWRMYAPHKLKFAVSGCPRNCAEAGIKDVGIIGVDSGWEMYIAGNGGIKTEVAHFFTKLKTAQEGLEYSGGLWEVYRQEGWYQERSVHYVGRVGLEHVKKRILQDPAGRKALWERLQCALADEPDPWVEFDKAALDTRQFAALSA